MNISQQGINLIKNFEGFRPFAYHCSAGALTIGFGHVIKQGETLGNILLDEKSKISFMEALNLLSQDIKIAEADVARYVTVPLNQGQFDALVSFVFNLGAKQLSRSTLLKKLNARDYEGAGNQFPRWVYANHKALPGLMTRRAAELKLWKNETKA